MGQPRIPPTPSGIKLVGKTIVITGGNAGLGLEAARQYLILGASRVILACRSIPRGQEAVSKLRADPVVKDTNPDAIIGVFELDLADYQSGLRFAQKVKQEVKELDILLNNGGQVVMKYEKAPSGHERNLQEDSCLRMIVNCLTHILICLELFPLLRATAASRGSPTRITYTGSATQIRQHTLSKKPITSTETVLGHFDEESKYSSLFRYADTKLVVNAHVRQLAQLAPSEVIVNNICPGLVQTGLDKSLPIPLKLLMALVRRSAGRTPEEGARTLIYASVVAGPETNGKFMQNNKIDEGAEFLNGPNGEKFIGQLWEETLEDVIKVDPTVSWASAQSSL